MWVRWAEATALTGRHVAARKSGGAVDDLIWWLADPRKPVFESTPILPSLDAAEISPSGRRAVSVFTRPSHASSAASLPIAGRSPSCGRRCCDRPMIRCQMPRHPFPRRPPRRQHRVQSPPSRHRCNVVRRVSGLGKPQVWEDSRGSRWTAEANRKRRHGFAVMIRHRCSDF